MIGYGMKEFQFERKQRFSLRKYTIGACSVLLGTSLFLLVWVLNLYRLQKRVQH